MLNELIKQAQEILSQVGDVEVGVFDEGVDTDRRVQSAKEFVYLNGKFVIIIND